MRHRHPSIKPMSPSLAAGIAYLLLLTGCGKEQAKEEPQPEGPALALPEGVLHRPNDPLSPGLVLEPREGQPHLLHVTIDLPEGKQLLRLRVLGAGPGFEELANKDMSQLDGLRVKESFDLATTGSKLEARHVLVIAEYEGVSYGAAQAMPGL